MRHGALVRLLNSEWIKLRSEPLPGWGSAIVLVVGTVLGLVRAGSVPPADSADPVAVLNLTIHAATMGVLPAQLFAVLLGVGSLAGEYSTGAIRTTLMAAPRRVRLIWAKAMVLAVYAAVVTIVSGATAAAGAALVLSLKGYSIDAGVAAGSILPLLGAGAFVGLVAVMALGVGAILLHPPAGILVMVLLLFVAPTAVALAASTGSHSADWAAALLPSVAGQALYAPEPGHPDPLLGAVPLPPAVGGATVLAWVAGIMIPASVVFARRDEARAASTSAASLSPGPRPPSVSDGRAAGQSWRGVLRAEWIKLRSLPSARWSVLAVAVALLGYGFVRAATRHPADVGGTVLEASRIETAYTITAGIGVAQLVVGIVAVTMITGEYSSGTIKPTLAAVPARLSVVLAKALVAAAGAAAVGVLLLSLVAVAVMPVQRASGFSPEFFGTATYSPILGGALYLALVALLALSIGGIARSAVGGVITISALLVVLPAVFNVLLAVTRGTPAVWLGNLGRFLPASGDLFYLQVRSMGSAPSDQFAPDGALVLSADQGLAVLAVWAVVAFAIWAVTFLRRDA